MERDILTNNGMDIHLVRYFDYNGKKYLIYTSDGENETDNQGHTFVHIAGVDNLTATAVEGEDYETVKNIIKDVVMKNRNNLPLPITDLNYNELNGLNIVSNKQLGLLPNYIDILKQNQPDFKEVNAPTPVEPVMEPVNPFVPEQPQMVTDNIDTQDNAFNPFNLNASEPTPIPSENTSTNYEQMYLEQVETINRLNIELEQYRNKIETIKNIINN